MHRPRLKMVGRGSGRHRLASNAVPGFCVRGEEGALFLSVVTSASGVDTSFFSHGPTMFAASRLVFKAGICLREFVRAAASLPLLSDRD